MLIYRNWDITVENDMESGWWPTFDSFDNATHTNSTQEILDVSGQCHVVCFLHSLTTLVF